MVQLEDFKVIYSILQFNTQDADQNGGLGHKTTSVAGEYRCIAIKCSADDSCLFDGMGKGYLKVFSGTKIAIKIPIAVQHDLRLL